MVYRRWPDGDPTLPIIGHLKLYPQKVLIRLMMMAYEHGIWDDERQMWYILDGRNRITQSLYEHGENISEKQVEHSLNKLEDQQFIMRVEDPEYKGKWPTRYRTYLPMLKGDKQDEGTNV